MAGEGAAAAVEMFVKLVLMTVRASCACGCDKLRTTVGSDDEPTLMVRGDEAGDDAGEEDADGAADAGLCALCVVLVLADWNETNVSNANGRLLGRSVVMWLLVLPRRGLSIGQTRSAGAHGIIGLILEGFGGAAITLSGSSPSTSCNSSTS